MIWSSFALALAFGLVVSAGLYVAYLWAEVEPTRPGRQATDTATQPETD